MQSSAWPSSAPHQLAGVGVVTYLVDGDTIVMDLGERQSGRIRYIGIDTPERGRPSYAEAKEANRRLVATRLLLLADDVQDTDGSRLLRYVCLEDGTFVNAELVR
jgi:micrococcal nuclease